MYKIISTQSHYSPVVQRPVRRDDNPIFLGGVALESWGSDSDEDDGGFFLRGHRKIPHPLKFKLRNNETNNGPRSPRSVAFDHNEAASVHGLFSGISGSHDSVKEGSVAARSLSGDGGTGSNSDAGTGFGGLFSGMSGDDAADDGAGGNVYATPQKTSVKFTPVRKRIVSPTKRTSQRFNEDAARQARDAEVLTTVAGGIGAVDKVRVLQEDGRIVMPWSSLGDLHEYLPRVIDFFEDESVPDTRKMYMIANIVEQLSDGLCDIHGTLEKAHMEGKPGNILV